MRLMRRDREGSFPFVTARQPVSRPALLNLLFTLQHQLEGQEQHRAFLSVDVVGPSEREQAPGLFSVRAVGPFAFVAPGAGPAASQPRFSRQALGRSPP
jgi:hypothetical protein